jgi:hypothetical protein
LGIVTIGGLAAVALGTAALVKLKRRRGELGGHAWAITGLCTGPWPLLGGAIVGIVMGVELIGSTTMCASVPEDEGSAATASYSAPEGIYVSPATGLPVPACMPAPMARVASEPDCLPAPAARASVGPDELLPPRAAPAYVPVQATADDAPASESEPRPEPPAVP